MICFNTCVYESDLRQEHKKYLEADDAPVKLAIVKSEKMSEFVGQWVDHRSSEVTAFGFFSQL